MHFDFLKRKSFGKHLVEVSLPRVPNFNVGYSALSESTWDYSGCKDVRVLAADLRVKVAPWYLHVLD